MGAIKNDVIITIYVESVTNRTKYNRHGLKKKKSKAKPLPKPLFRRGYDRRTQLLDYVQNLRNANGHNHRTKWANNKKSSLKSKRWRWSPSLGTVSLRFHRLCLLLKRQRRYKCKATNEQSELESLLGSERVTNSRKRKASKTNYSHFWRKLGSICIGLICAWKCSKGAEKNI